MKIYVLKVAILLIVLAWQQSAFNSNLDGTAGIVYKTQHHVFSNGESALGYVRMNGGFTVKPTAKVTLDTFMTVSGSIDLRETGVLQLISDLQLDSGVTWSSGGYINGRSCALILNGPLSIPASKVIHIIGDTVIEGNGNTLLFSENAQIFVDDNITLSLRNLIVRNTRNSKTNGCLKIGGNRGRLALDNVILRMGNDIDFTQGKLYIHNDVVFSGTSVFTYNSTVPSFIAPSGTLKFDVDTTFSFAPTTTTDHLFQLQDRTTNLYLKGCTLNTTTSGMRLTKGKLIIENKVVFNTNSGVDLSTLSTFTSASLGNSGSTINAVTWSPDGNFIFVGGSSALAVGGFANTNGIRVYRVQGSSLVAIASQPYGTTVLQIKVTSDGQYVAVVGQGVVSGGGFSNTNDIRIYGFNGSALAAITSRQYGTQADNVSWTRDGAFLAIGGGSAIAGGGFGNTDKLRIYKFNGGSLTAITSRDFGTLAGSFIEYTEWSPDNKYLAVVGTQATAVGGFSNTNNIRIYSFDGSTLTAVTSQPYGGATTGVVFTCAWSPDGKVLAVGGSAATSGGGFANTDELRLYSFNGTSLTALVSQPYGTQIDSLSWSPNGEILVVGGNGAASGGGFSNTDELRLYRLNGASLTAVTSKARGSNISDCFFNPDGSLLITGGAFATNPSGGFTNHDHLRIYSSNFIKDSSPQADSRSIIFGNNLLGSGSNLNVEILSAAHVTVNGVVSDESV